MAQLKAEHEGQVFAQSYLVSLQQVREKSLVQKGHGTVTL